LHRNHRRLEELGKRLLRAQSYAHNHPRADRTQPWRCKSLQRLALGRYRETVEDTTGAAVLEMGCREDFQKVLSELSWSPSGASIFGSLDEACDEKLDHLHRRRDAVLLFAESVTLVRKQDVLDRHTPPLQVLDDLLGLDDRDVRVVRAMLDHQRCFDAIQLPQR